MPLTVPQVGLAWPRSIRERCRSWCRPRGPGLPGWCRVRVQLADRFAEGGLRLIGAAHRGCPSVRPSA